MMFLISLNKQRQSLLELAISDRIRNHCLWLPIQSYSAIPKNLRKQAKAIIAWDPKERVDHKIHVEKSVLTDNELVIVTDLLGMSKYACLCIRNEHPVDLR